MANRFAEWGDYDRLIRTGEWSFRIAQEPFAAHYWWHSYHSETNMVAMYGDLLFQSAGMVAERRLGRFADLLGKRAETMGMALAEFAERFGDEFSGAGGGKVASASGRIIQSQTAKPPDKTRQAVGTVRQSVRRARNDHRRAMTSYAPTGHPEIAQGNALGFCPPTRLSPEGAT